jgi:prepilin-type N-terminal cleavage/methylation domain-containing protein
MKSIRWLQGFRKRGQNLPPLLRIAECGVRNQNSKFRNPKSAFERGFTLIEIIIVIVILSIVSAITIKFLIDSLKIYTMTVNQKTLFDEGKLALERMCRDIRDAKSITGSTATSITFVRTNATAYDLGLPGNPIGETISFQLNVATSTLVKVKASPVVTSVLAENVNNFAVTRDASNEITLLLTLRLVTGENVTLQTKVYPKNLPKDPTTYKNFYNNWREEPSS